MRIRRKLMTATAIVAGVVMATAGLSLAASVDNGGFESGDFTGWTTVEAGSGSWSVYTGSSTPTFGQTVPAPPEGTNAAATEQSGPGTHILYQDIELEADAVHRLTFFLYYNSSASITVPAGGSLDHTGGPNQQFRVDLIDPAADVDSVAADDVIENLFQTENGDPTSMDVTDFLVDLTPYAGQTVRLRFAEADNGGNFVAGVDAVEVATWSITNAVPDDEVTLGDAVSTTATLTGLEDPTGDLDFALYGPDDADCSGDAVFTASVALTGDGDFESGEFTPTEAGTYRWVVSYPGDQGNATLETECGADGSTVLVTSSQATTTTASTVPTPPDAAPAAQPTTAQPDFTG